MNITQTIINAVIVLLLPFSIGWGILFERWLAQRLPDHQGPRLEQFARMAVQNVLYQHENSTDQRELAATYTILLFKKHHAEVPSRDVIDIAVGSAMFEARLPDKIG